MRMAVKGGGWSLGLLLAAVMLCSGCGRGDPTYAVRGKVTYQGQAIQHGSVMFNPVDAALPPVLGRIQSDGTYEVTAAPGEYSVVVTVMSEADSGLEPDDPAYKPPQSLIPEKYSNPRATPLKASVSENENVVDLQL